MENPLRERWHSRDFPVLIQAARRLDDGEVFLDSGAIAAELGITSVEVRSAVKALAQAGYLDNVTVEHSLRAGDDEGIFELTERGRRTVGIWPSGDGADALVEALRQAEDATSDPEEKTLIRRAAGALGSVSRDVLADVTAALIRSQTGI